MHIVGVVEIVAGFVVLVSPRFGGLLVAAWLAGIIGSLLLVGGYGDIVCAISGCCWPRWPSTGSRPPPRGATPRLA